MTRRIEIQVGLTVLLALVVLLWGVTWLKEFGLQKKVTVWHVRFPQTGGLGVSDEVQVNGIRKGAVTAIQLVGDQAAIDLSLATDVRLTRDCRVSIRNVGMMGEKVIAVDLRTTGAPFGANDTIQGIYELGIPEVVATMGGTITAIEDVATELDSVARSLRANGSLDRTLANLRETTEGLRDVVKENRKPLQQTIADAAVTMRAARELTAGHTEQYKRLLDSAERATHNVEVLSQRLDSLRATAQGIGDKLDHGDGTAARLLNDEKLYEEMRASLKTLRELLADIQAHPKKYVHVSVF